MPLKMALRNAKPREKLYKIADSDGLFLVVGKRPQLWRSPRRRRRQPHRLSPSKHRCKFDNRLLV